MHQIECTISKFLKPRSIVSCKPRRTDETSRPRKLVIEFDNLIASGRLFQIFGADALKVGDAMTVLVLVMMRRSAPGERSDRVEMYSMINDDKYYYYYYYINFHYAHIFK